MDTYEKVIIETAHTACPACREMAWKAIDQLGGGRTASAQSGTHEATAYVLECWTAEGLANR